MNDSFEEEDWIPQSQSPAAKPQLPLRETGPGEGSPQLNRKPSPSKSFIPRLASRTPRSDAHLKPLPGKHSLHSDENRNPKSVLVAADESINDNEETPDLFVQAASPTASPQGTMVRKPNGVSAGGAPVSLLDRGSEDLFTPIVLESIFEPPSPENRDTKPQTTPSVDISHTKQDRTCDISQPNDLAPSSSHFDSTNERFSEADNPFFTADKPHYPTTPQRFAAGGGDGPSRLTGRPESHWDSTPPHSVAGGSEESSEHLRSSLFREATPSPTGKDGEYLNSISTSAFSDQSPGLNGLLHVTSRSEFSRQMYTDFHPEQSSLSQNNQIYFATPDRRILQFGTRSNVSVTSTPESFRDAWSPLKLFSSNQNAFTKATLHDRMSHIELLNSSFDDNETSFTRPMPNLSFANNSKRMWDGTPVSCHKSDKQGDAKSLDMTQSYCLHPPSPVKENKPKRQKLSTINAAKKSASHKKDIITDSSIEDSLEGDSLSDSMSDLQQSTSKLQLEPEIDFSRSPYPNFMSKPQLSSSLNVILASRVKHMMPSKVGDMIFDEKRMMWLNQHDASEDSEQDASSLHNRQGVGGADSAILANVDDPFYEISDLPASPVPNPFPRSSGFEPKSTAPKIGSPTRGPSTSKGESSKKEPIIEDTRAKEVSDNISEGSASSLRPISPDFDPQKSYAEEALDTSISTESEAFAGGATNIVDNTSVQPEATMGLNKGVGVTPLISSTMEGSYLRFPHSQNTPSEPLRQYTLSMQTNGRPSNGAVLSIRKSELSLWNTPLTDITYHFLEGDSRMNSAYSAKGYQTRTGRQLRKLNREKNSLAVKSMVKHLTNNDMFGPYWDQNKALQIQKQGLEHLQDLAGFHPNLVEANLEHNELTHLMGLPSTIRDLKVAGNQLSSLTAWTHLTNLQFLDISRNNIESLLGLASLVHLRELKADDNEINSLDGIMFLDGLVKVRIRRNRLTSVDFSSSLLKRLKSLDLAHNKIERIGSLHHLPELLSLNLDSNSLDALDLTPDQGVRSLRTLNASNNRLRTFDASPFPNLRTLYLDMNQLEAVDGIAGARYLDSFSVRSQNSICKIPFEKLYETRKVYASGNPISSFQVDYHFANLQYLELASCGIRTLPSDFGQLMSNVRILNLNNNAVSDIRPLSGIIRLKKLFLVGNRVSNLQKFSSVLKLLPSLSELDLRHNPLSHGFYAVLSKCTDVAVKSNEESDPSPFLLQHQNTAEDEKFQSSMAEDTAVARRCYEILIGEQCSQMSYLDGLTFDIERKLREDRVWERMAKLGLIFQATPKPIADVKIDISTCN